MPMPSECTSAPLARRRTDTNTITPEPTRINSASIAAARFSILSWPYGWSASAGLSAVRTDTYATIDAIRSTDECIASVMIATEPVSAPATSFSTIRTEFDAIDRAAARVVTVPRALRLPAMSGPVTVSPPAARAARGPRARGG